MTKQPITLNDILDALRVFSDHVDAEFENMRNELRDEFNGKFNDIRSEFNQIKATMVTKDYLDVKLADIKGEFTGMMRGEDYKVIALVQTLFKKDVLSKTDVKHIMAMPPFGTRI